MTVQCAGCSGPIPPSTDARSLRSWCDHCAPIASDFYAIERAARLAAAYGIALETAIGDVPERIRQQLRSGAGPARGRAEAERQRLEARNELRAHPRRTIMDLMEALAPLTSGPLPHTGRWWWRDIAADLFGDFAEERRERDLSDYAGTTRADDGRAPEELLREARNYLERRLAEDGTLIVSVRRGSRREVRLDGFDWPSVGTTRAGSQERQ